MKGKIARVDRKENERQLREKIAAHLIEAFGCKCWKLDQYREDHDEGIGACPLNIAVAIREGRL